MHTTFLLPITGACFGWIYHTTIRLILLYSTEHQVIKRYRENMSVAEMCIIRWMYGDTRIDKVRNKYILTKAGVVST